MSLILAPYNSAMRLGTFLAHRKTLSLHGYRLLTRSRPRVRSAIEPYYKATYLTVFSFNSYTQQICIDDAVVIDSDRIGSAATKDGITMRDLRYSIGARAKAARAAEEDEYEGNDEEEEENNLESENSRGATQELFKRGLNQIVSYSSRVVNKIRYLMASLALFLFFFFLPLFKMPFQ